MYTKIKEIIYLLLVRIPMYLWGKYIRKNVVLVHWGRGLNNFGDCLSPDILKHYGLTPVFVPQKKSDIVLAGSILQWIPSDFSGYIVGTGGDDKQYNFPNATILAVRGKLTLKNIQNKKSNIKLGDPGLLMSYVYPNKIKKKYRLGIIQHFVDSDTEVIRLWKKHFGKDVLFIDVLQSPSKVINEIKQCAAIASSSLHGLIIADAFHIPNVRFVDRKTMPTYFYDYKFDDYYSSLSVSNSLIEVDGSETVDFLIDSTTQKPIEKITKLQESLNSIMLELSTKLKHNKLC